MGVKESRASITIEVCRWVEKEEDSIRMKNYVYVIVMFMDLKNSLFFETLRMSLHWQGRLSSYTH